MTSLLVHLDGDILRVTINRPEKRNPLSREVLAALRQAFDSHRSQDVRLAIVTAAGSKNFAAGGDLRELDAVRTRPEAEGFSDEAHAALDAIRRFPQPVIAAINGDAIGGGAELAVACDIRLMAAHARIGFIQGRLNISTAWGGGPDLMRLVGPARALSLLCRSTMLTGPEAVALGLAEAVCPDAEDFPAFVDAFAAPMRRQTRLVLRAFKAQSIAARFGLPREGCRQVERDFFSQTWMHEDHWSAAARALAPAR